jgi:ribonucleoside-diphosphate reductase alpha chain
VGPATRFTDPVSVETWDACFRWRADDALRDVTIDDTWWRVIDAVASPDRGTATDWAHRYFDAFSRWRLLPDERLLRCAGSDRAPGAVEPPAAVLNVAAFLHAPIGGVPRLERTALVETAALAVRLLDDAMRNTRIVRRDAGLRVGLVGFGDALRTLGIPYAAPAAQEFARTVAQTLAEGCMRGAVALAEARGAFASGVASPGMAMRWHALGLPETLIESATQTGLRHAQLTALDRHPLLARLANGASDALEDVVVPLHATRRADPVLVTAERALCAAMQPWIDAPIGGTEAALAALVRAAITSEAGDVPGVSA